MRNPPLGQYCEAQSIRFAQAARSPVISAAPPELRALCPKGSLSRPAPSALWRDKLLATQAAPDPIPVGASVGHGRCPRGSLT